MSGTSREYPRGPHLTGRRGRKPKPMALKIAEGIRADQINFNEPQYEGEVKAPEWLIGRALEHWHEMAPILVKSGCMTVADRAALAMMCLHYQAILDGTASQAEQNRYLKYLVEFGLTPSSRTRVR